MPGVYEDAFVLHEETTVKKYKQTNEEKDKARKKTDEGSDKTDPIQGQSDKGSDKNDPIEDPRKDINLTRKKWFKFLSLLMIRNYFGEKIGLYFAWAGTLLNSLWLPMFFGLACFIYGITVR